MERYLIDNNVISGYFSVTYTESAMNFVAGIFDSTPVISVITEIEALSWVSADKRRENTVRAFVEDASILPLSAEVARQCVKIKRGRKIKTPDAIIAATAIVHNLTLVSSDA